MSLLIPTGRYRVRKIPKKDLMAKRPDLREVSRPFGKPEGSWVADLVDLKKAIVLCQNCKHKFDHEASKYYMDRKFPYVLGTCAGCRSIAYQGRLYIHESLLTGPGGRTRSGQVWTPV